ncbi:hypothetical protein Pcinc_042295 [Petrolisthes cinctipes]|uniref:COMM domain-containing protein n=1 Tax=Petrolisthes cinctipes TaxID=88211 RepID=A0AAE1BIA3_PETCI|nr:hypothetical protein Pcinc_042295 [Petrolisthes cinctipes]
MRFRFCWDVDCPDWLLAEIATLSKLTSVKLRLMAGSVAKSIFGEPLSHDVITKLATDAKISECECSAGVAAVRWVLVSGAGAGVGAAVLDSELQQLGLPREHAAAITRVYTTHLPALTQHLKDTSLRAGGETEFDCHVVGVDVSGGEVEGKQQQQQQVEVKPIIQLMVQEKEHSPTTTTTTATTLTLTPTQLNALVQELGEARQLMESMH